jgi:hypothetical protein
MAITKTNKECVKWVVILPIFLILIIDFIDIIVASHYNPILPEDAEYDYHFYYGGLFDRIKLFLTSCAFLAICCCFKHCKFTWVATLTFFMYKLLGLLYNIFVFDYNLYIKLVFILIIIGILLIIIMLLYKLWIGLK